MGWNSWDAYGLTISEEQFRANTQVLVGLKSYGWNYAVVDEGWYFADAQARPEARKSFWDANGRLIPDTVRYPSAANGAGFKPLADWTHAQGLKFGIHIVRGIPKGVVTENLPVANSSFHASDVADTSDPCPWDNGNFGVRDNPAGQAYYDSMMRLYAGWGLDFLKVDCIADHPYKGAEIRMIAKAIENARRPIVLSLSPGPTDLSHAAAVAQYSQIKASFPKGSSPLSITWQNGRDSRSLATGPTRICFHGDGLRPTPAGDSRASRASHRTRSGLSSRSGRFRGRL